MASETIGYIFLPQLLGVWKNNELSCRFIGCLHEAKTNAVQHNNKSHLHEGYDDPLKLKLRKVLIQLLEVVVCGVLLSERCFCSRYFRPPRVYKYGDVPHTDHIDIYPEVVKTHPGGPTANIYPRAYLSLGPSKTFL